MISDGDRQSRPRRRALTPDDAEAIALQALAFLAETDTLGRFCFAAGIPESDLRERAADPEVLGAVLDFILEDDGRVQAMAAWADLTPETVARARHLLPGASQF